MSQASEGELGQAEPSDFGLGSFWSLGRFSGLDAHCSSSNKKQSFLLQRGLSYRGVYGALFELEPDVPGVLLIIWSFV